MSKIIADMVKRYGKPGFFFIDFSLCILPISQQHYPKIPKPGVLSPFVFSAKAFLLFIEDSGN